MTNTESLVFTCGNAEDESGGIFTHTVNERKGTLREVAHTSEKAVSYLAVHPGKETLYTVSGEDGGTVTTYRIEASSGELTKLNCQLSGGSDPCYISVDATGCYAFVANYAGGSVSTFSIAEEGHLAGLQTVVHHEGSSVNPERQDVPHPHSIGPCPNNRFAYAPDLGTDQVVIYEIDHETGNLLPADVPDAPLHEGAGPRHFEFHPNKHVVYVINELDSTVTTFNWDPETGGLDRTQSVSALPEGYDGETYAADIHVHPSGEWVYASNRGHDSIAIFEVDASGTLDLLDHQSTDGEWPRDFALDPDGRYLYVENQLSDSLVAFSIDGSTGELTPTGHRQDFPEPVCLRFRNGA